MSTSRSAQFLGSAGRRAFLQHTTAMAAITTLFGATATIASAAANEAPRTEFPALGEAIGAALTRVARDIYPHDRLPDELYRRAVAPYDAAAGKDGAFKALLVEGVTALDRSSRLRFGSTYAALAAEEDRVALLRDIEGGPFFRRLQSDLLFSLYNSAAVWPLLGYEGSSWEKGGYLHRGFDDIDWL